jgi:hypothetical protein
MGMLTVNHLSQLVQTGLDLQLHPVEEALHSQIFQTNSNSSLV